MPHTSRQLTATSEAQWRRFGWLGVCGLVALVGGVALRTCDRTALAQPQPEARPADSVVARGREVYAGNCAGCHGDKGDGKGPMARFLNPRPRNFGEAKFR